MYVTAFVLCQTASGFNTRMMSKMCAAWPWLSSSCWKCCEVKRKGFCTHRLNDWFYLVCLLSPGLAVLVCYVGFYGEKHRPCQTLSSTRSEKKGEKHVQGRGGGGAREIWVQEFRGCGFMARMTRQIESIFAAEKKLLCCCTKPVFQLLLLWTTAANQDFWTLSTNWSCRLYVVRYSTNKDGESGSYVCPHWSWAAMQEANVYNELSMNTITVWRISIIICLFCANRWREKVGGFDFFSK